MLWWEQRPNEKAAGCKDIQCLSRAQVGIGPLGQVVGFLSSKLWGPCSLASVVEHCGWWWQRCAPMDVTVLVAAAAATLLPQVPQCSADSLQALARRRLPRAQRCSSCCFSNPSERLWGWGQKYFLCDNWGRQWGFLLARSCHLQSGFLFSISPPVIPCWCLISESLWKGVTGVDFEWITPLQPRELQGSWLLVETGLEGRQPFVGILTVNSCCRWVKVLGWGALSWSLGAGRGGFRDSLADSLLPATTDSFSAREQQEANNQACIHNWTSQVLLRKSVEIFWDGIFLLCQLYLPNSLLNFWSLLWKSFCKNFHRNNPASLCLRISQFLEFLVLAERFPK